MDKNLFFSNFEKSDKELIYKLYNAYEIAKNTGEICYTNEFLTPDFWNKLNGKFDGLSIISYGIFKNSERKQMAFYEKESHFEFPFSIIKILNKSKFKNLKHKDYLGSIMGLNIKRELLGDLIVEDDICYVAVSNSVVDHILSELHQIGKTPCEVLKIDKKEVENIDYKFNSFEIQVNSLRLDSVVSEITNLSRSKTENQIKEKKIKVNYIDIVKKDKEINIEDTLTIKGYGKYKIGENLGNTKKGKIKIRIKQFL